MNIGFCADVHLWSYPYAGGKVTAGLNRRAWEQIDVLRRTVKAAKEHCCSHLVILGDLFDRAKPEPQLLAAVREVLVEYELNVIILVGNHDQVSSEPGDHALNTLTWPNTVKVIETPTLLVEAEVEFICIPHQAGQADEWLPETLSGTGSKSLQCLPALESKSARTRFLLLHLGIRDENTASFMQSSHDSVHIDALEEMSKKYHIDFAAAGNWHKRDQWDRDNFSCVQCGTLIPHSFSDEGLDRRGDLILWKDGEWSKEQIPGPRFIKREWNEENLVGDIKGTENIIYLRLVTTKELYAAANTHLKELDIQHGEVKIVATDQITTREEIKSTTDSLTETMKRYIENQTFDNRVDKDVVLERSLGFME